MRKEPIIKIENLGKQYRLGAVGTGTLSHDINRWWHKVRGKEDPYLKIGEVNDRTKDGGSDYVWALQDINFEVQPGEILGIIGKNGAGKSTLLKLLSRVTAPTTGKITCNGRIASLLEVGTGFHPELTGRENIFLNGAILGMSKKEIASKFDEIVDFAGCAKYIETPVKRYSSGMYVRLAFAVAAHLEPDILVVDEVLAVGDAEFQKKAIGKMQDVSKNSGRTVLFVSHNMAAVQRLCPQSIILKNGRLTHQGNTADIIPVYLEQSKEDILENNYVAIKEKEQPYFKNIQVLNSKNEVSSNLFFGEPFSIKLIISAKQDYNIVEPLVAINSMDDHRIITAISSDQRLSYQVKANKDIEISVRFNEKLTPNSYKLIFALRSGRNTTYDVIFDALKLNITEQVYNDIVPNENVLGFLRVAPEWIS